MSDIKPEPVLVAQNAQTARSSEFRDIYSNHVRVGVSPVDFGITFGKIIEPSIGINIIEDQAVVRMSAQQFKSFLDSANKTMTAWEEVFGSIQETNKPQSQTRITEGIKGLKQVLDRANS